jgi:fatty acid desaturase
MEKTAKYGTNSIDLPGGALSELQKLDEKKSFGAIVFIWAQIIALISVMQYGVEAKYFWYLYVPAIFLIAGRIGALLQVTHEASHVSVCKSKGLNDGLAKWVCAYPIGVNYEGYASGHILHHAHAGTKDDPPSDSEKYRIANLKDPGVYVLFLKDILGITALQVFFNYKTNKGGSQSKRDSMTTTSPLVQFFQLCLVQVVLVGLLFQFNAINYVLLWLVPAMSPHMFLMRIRGIAEHGLAKQTGFKIENIHQGTLYTRSFMTPKSTYSFSPLVWVEKSLIGSLDIGYHHEHHLYPKIPFYNLHKAHSFVADQVLELNPDVYAKGYFSAAARNLFA